MVSALSNSHVAILIRDLQQAAQVRKAFAFFETHHAAITDEHIKICRIPAPPFGEAERAAYLCERFQSLKLTDVRTDAEGNAVGLRRGRTLKPLLVVSAHLDTVFPADTDFTVRVDDRILRAPGIADDGCGLAALVALIEAMNEARIETQGSILFAGTVGEEGEGNLRGVRHLLTNGEWAREIDAFISIDGPGIERITNAALGSRRWRVRFAGTGGHSWGDFGVANPVHAMGRLIARLAAYPLPARTPTSFNVGRIEGGSSVNVIASEAVMDVDLRSESDVELTRIDAYFRRAMHESIDDENAARRAGTAALIFDVKLIGDRPSGQTACDAMLVRLAEEATRPFGVAPRLDCSSTDSNIAIAHGIPAITIGAGGSSGNSHTLDEWYDATNRHIGLQRDLLVLLGMTGLIT